MLEEVVEKIQLSKKYKYISEKTILELVKIELPKHKSEKNLIKAVKNRLHQVYGAFLSRKDTEKISKLLSTLESGGEDIRDIAKEILRLHQSTRERLDIYEELYREIFDVTGKPSSMMDLACGLNPFSIPYMNIDRHVDYYAYDIDSTVIENVNRFLGILGYPRLASVKDVLFERIEEYSDLCLLFKFLPTAERIRKGSSSRLLKSINSRFIVVSFPLKSISGKEKGMLENYSRIFEPVMEESCKIKKKFVLGNEIFYILTGGNDG